MKKLLLLMAFLLSLILPSFALAESAIVTKVIDGDTIKVILEGDTNTTTIRFAGIDTPETSSFSYKAKYDNKKCTNKLLVLGKKSKAELNTLVAVGDKVIINFIDEKSHDRSVGIVIANGINLNQVMVQRGYAYMYHGGRDLKPSVDPTPYLTSQNYAKNGKQGLWGTDGTLFQCLVDSHQ